MASADDFFEAVIYAVENDEDWWDQFDSIKDAKRSLNLAKNEVPDEHITACIATLVEEDYFESENLSRAYLKYLRQLRNQIPTDI